MNTRVDPSHPQHVASNDAHYGAAGYGGVFIRRRCRSSKADLTSPSGPLPETEKARFVRVLNPLDAVFRATQHLDRTIECPDTEQVDSSPRRLDVGEI